MQKNAPELHKQAAIYAITHQISLNGFVEQALQQSLSQADAS